MKKISFARIFNFAVILLFAFIMLAPYMWMITTSLKPRNMMGEPPYLIPTSFRFENYKIAWEAAPFLRYYINTLIVALGVIASRIIFASLAAYSFAIMKFKGRDFLFLLFLGTMMIPFQSIIIPSYQIARDFNWFNTFQVLIVPRMVDAFSIFLLRQNFVSIPKDYLDAAKMDGCNDWQTLWRIVFPLAQPTVLTMSLFTFLFIWNDFLWPLLVANAEKMRVIQVGLQAFSGRYQVEWTYMMAGTVMATILPILIFFIAQKQFISGIMKSGIKG